jgi:chromosome segregation ATPase
MADAIPAPSVLAGQLTGFQAQLEESLGTLERLRQQINDSYEHLARLEDEHNTVVRELLAFREALGDTNQRSYVDSIVGDNLWSYAARS